MEIQQAPTAGDAAPAAPEPNLSIFARAIAIFANPAGAWSGLRTRSQWWFPLVVMTLLGVGATMVLHERALLPTMTEQWERLVEDGRMTQEQLDQTEARMRSPFGMLMTSVPQVVIWPLMMVILAAGVSFGVSFMAGTKLAFGHSFEVVCWSSLVLIPAQIVTSVLAWAKESMRGIHLGLGILVPQAEPPEKWQVGVASFLDAFGPFELWCVAVVVLGATALSGANRKTVAWVLVGLYLGLRLLMAGLAAMFAPGA